MSNQRQEAQNGSVAIQSQRDVIITNNFGPSLDEIRSIVHELVRSELANYAAQAKATVEHRLRDFEQHIVRTVAETSRIRAEAFTDPDFQYQLVCAQHAYARSGDETVRDVLIDLIARRSQETERGRLSLTLSQAVETAAHLTKNEFAELSLSYILRNVLDRSVDNMAALSRFCITSVFPLLRNVSKEMASYQYIEAQSCGTLSFGEITLLHLLSENYSGIFSKGFEASAVERLPSGVLREFLKSSNLLIPCLNDPTRLQLRVLNKQVFLERAQAAGLTERDVSAAWDLFQGTIWNGEELKRRVEQGVPQITSLIQLWDHSGLKKLTLTSLGIAIGHANLVRVCKFQGDLKMWIP